MRFKGLKLVQCLLASAALIYIGNFLIFASGSDQMANIKQLDLRLVHPLYYFTNKLFKQVRDVRQNIVLSPISVHSALNMVLLGAKSGSKSERDLLETLGYSDLNGTVIEAHKSYLNLLNSFKQINDIAAQAKLKQPAAQSGNYRLDEDKYTELDVWNMAILKDTMEPLANYLDDIKTYYNSTVKRIRDDKPADKQQLADSINLWGKNAGFDMALINKGDLDARFSLMLLSAIKVHGWWFEQFNEHNVRNAFYNNGDSKKPVESVRCLSDGDLKGKYLEFTKKQSRQAYLSPNEQSAIEELAGPTFYVVEIPLRDKLSFAIFEPLTNGSGDELSKLEDHLLTQVDPTRGGVATKLHKVFQLLDGKERKDTIEYIQFPKFKFESNLDLESSLKSIGLQRLFGAEAELTRMAPDNNLRISKVNHQAVIEVNKFGLKAAGVTSVKIVPLSLKLTPSPIRLSIKYPFMFVVRYEKMPLFVGHLVQV